MSAFPLTLFWLDWKGNHREHYFNTCAWLLEPLFFAPRPSGKKTSTTAISSPQRRSLLHPALYWSHGERPFSYHLTMHDMCVCVCCFLLRVLWWSTISGFAPTTSQGCSKLRTKTWTHLKRKASSRGPLYACQLEHSVAWAITARFSPAGVAAPQPYMPFESGRQLNRSNGNWAIQGAYTSMMSEHVALFNARHNQGKSRSHFQLKL